MAANGAAPVNGEAEAPRCFTFIKGKSEGNKGMKQLLGGKGANLCEMARLGLNVPPGVCITTETCQQYYKAGGKLPPGLWDEVLASLKLVEEAFQAPFASTTEVPMLLSVRSGAAVSMPGMMDTVLCLGMNDAVVANLEKHTCTRFAYDCYRRLLDMYANVVLGADHDLFEEALAKIKKARGAKFDVELTGDDLKEVVASYKAVYKSAGYEIPDDPYEQLRRAIGAVFGSWNTPRAVKYREINRVTGLKGTAVNVQAMVYGNFNDNSGTGVCFTRNPSTGEKKLFGEFLINAQGEDVVAGIRTPLPIAQMRDAFPPIYDELVDNTTLLETHMKDMQDCEFTVQDGRLFMLQTRSGKRVGAAALRVAMEMQREGLTTKEQSVLMVEPRHLDQLLHPQFADQGAYTEHVIGTGLAASPGAAVGRVVFSAKDAEDWRANGERVILMRTETSPEDVGGMHAAEGIITSRGGMTSHAAVVARGWGKPCVCGCEALAVDSQAKTAVVDNGGKHVQIKEGDWLSLNGTTGEVILGKQAVSPPRVAGDLAEFMSWADGFRRLRVLTNADTPEDAAFARANGAQGIGLVRTEHMFFSSADRIAAVRRMIAAEELHSNATAKQALHDIEAFQTADFEGIFDAMDGLPVTVRLLDPPLHEFLPKKGPQLDELCAGLAAELGVPAAQIASRVAGLQECNPMMGFRGCRLGIVHPEITTMQVNAVVQAAINAQKRGKRVHPHIMVPLAGTIEELQDQVGVVRAAAAATQARPGNCAVALKVGTMIEVPRAALVAGQLAAVADFFSFGTNDLTQMTYGYSRDDAESKFLPQYLKKNILPCDPFERIDAEGVGELITIACERGRAANPALEIGVCGEHGGDPVSIAFFDGVEGMAYVSCSPLRVPIARLAAAQSQLSKK